MPESKKVVIKVDVHDEKCKQKALKAVSNLPGIESLAMDMKDRKLTIVGDIDPVEACAKLKKWHTEIVTVGPKEDPKKAEEEKKKKEAEEKKKKEEAEKKKREEEEEACRKWLAANRCYNPCMITPQYCPQYCVHSVDDYPNNCVIS